MCITKEAAHVTSAARAIRARKFGKKNGTCLPKILLNVSIAELITEAPTSRSGKLTVSIAVLTSIQYLKQS